MLLISENIVWIKYKVKKFNFLYKTGFTQEHWNWSWDHFDVYQASIMLIKKVQPNIQGHIQVENLSVWNLYENQKVIKSCLSIPAFLGIQPLINLAPNKLRR